MIAERFTLEAESILGAHLQPYRVASTTSIVEDFARALQRAFDEGRDAERVNGEARLAHAVETERAECLKLCAGSRSRIVAASRIKARGK